MCAYACVCVLTPVCVWPVTLAPLKTLGIALRISVFLYVNEVTADWGLLDSLRMSLVARETDHVV